MKQIVIENPILNSPFSEPTRHFRFTEEGITNEIVEGERRVSSYFVSYTLNGEEHNYVPDFIVKLDDGHGRTTP
jgi:hypothetical protein